jgi:ribulose-phosphate 3-epimerase
MDGHFVPNLTFGPQLVRALRPRSSLPFDAHLMIAPYEPFLEVFAAAGVDALTIHVEAGAHLMRGLDAIRALGKRAGVAINPGTPVETIEPVLDAIDLVLVMTVSPGFGGQKLIFSTLEKIRRVRAMIGGRPIQIQVDGGIDPTTAPQAIAAGATVLVAGSSIFASTDYAVAIERLRPALAC